MGDVQPLYVNEQKTIVWHLKLKPTPTNINRYLPIIIFTKEAAQGFTGEMHIYWQYKIENITWINEVYLILLLTWQFIVH